MFRLLLVFKYIFKKMKVNYFYNMIVINHFHSSVDYVISLNNIILCSFQIILMIFCVFFSFVIENVSKSCNCLSFNTVFLVITISYTVLLIGLAVLIRLGKIYFVGLWLYLLLLFLL